MSRKEETLLNLIPPEPEPKPARIPYKSSCNPLQRPTASTFGLAPGAAAPGNLAGSTETADLARTTKAGAALGPAEWRTTVPGYRTALGADLAARARMQPARSRDRTTYKPALDNAPMELSRHAPRDYVTANAVEAITGTAPLRNGATQSPYDVKATAADLKGRELARNDWRLDDLDQINPEHGKVPSYLVERKEAVKVVCETDCQHPCGPVSCAVQGSHSCGSACLAHPCGTPCRKACGGTTPPAGLTEAARLAYLDQAREHLRTLMHSFQKGAHTQPQTLSGVKRKEQLQREIDQTNKDIEKLENLGRLVH